MRLCDEYSERMGLGRLYLRHSARFFLFFDEGDRLLSCKWVHNNVSCGHYEFSECLLGRTVNSLGRSRVEWDDYENFLSRWLGSHGGLVFDKAKVFDLAWLFFLRRNDRPLSSLADPEAIYSTLDESNKFRGRVALELLESISAVAPVVYDFWHARASKIVSSYAHWLEGFRGC